ncbi:amidase [Rhodococcoides yunnanense]|uniref:amidase n=1 Tax=Rhodococcoides yunnanense TaxID=278209 RepID=UPI000AFD9924|nr:amidase [Rhodococcus yunnanensis]
MPITDLAELTVAAAHSAYQDGSLTVREVVQYYLDRIEAVDRSGPHLNSVITVADGLLERADELDVELRTSGQLVGSLHGVPIVVKDQIETAGLRTTFGSEVGANNVPDADATALARLIAAGAIVLGKTTMPDFATSWFSTSSLTGVTKNPYALDRDPGGSSSGTAAAVAADLALVGIGEDTGGSIRLPASFCNLVGVRVTPGLISRTGMSSLVKTQDTAGPMTRTVEDAARVLDVLVGFDPADPYTASFVVGGFGGKYVDSLDSIALGDSRIGVLRAAFGDNSDPECKEVNDVVESALTEMASRGATFVDVDIDGLWDTVSYTSVYTSRAHKDMNDFLATRHGLEANSIEEIHESKRYHHKLDLFEAIVDSPASPEGDPEYLGRLQAQERFQQQVIALMVEHRLDAICFPDVQIAAPRHTDVMSDRWTCLTFPTNTVIASQLLFPAVTVPAGFTPGGLPVGLELMGIPHSESTLLGLAHGVESVVAARRPASLQ